MHLYILHTLYICILFTNNNKNNKKKKQKRCILSTVCSPFFRFYTYTHIHSYFVCWQFVCLCAGIFLHISAYINNANSFSLQRKLKRKKRVYSFFIETKREYQCKDICKGWIIAEKYAAKIVIKVVTIRMYYIQ